MRINKLFFHVFSVLVVFCAIGAGCSSNSTQTESTGTEQDPGTELTQGLISGIKVIGDTIAAPLSLTSGGPAGLNAYLGTASSLDFCLPSLTPETKCKETGAASFAASCTEDIRTPGGTSFRYGGTVTFKSCGAYNLYGPLSFQALLDEIPNQCLFQKDCPVPISLNLELSALPETTLLLNGKAIHSLHAFFECNLYRGEIDCLPKSLTGIFDGKSCGLEGETVSCVSTNLEDDIDPDHDGIPNNTDNCPSDFNPHQSDTDGDGIGDWCDDNVTGRSEDQLACDSKIGEQTCIAETDGDCCEGQYCGAEGTCQRCNDIFGVVGLSCRQGHPNDCCPGQYCRDNNECTPCPLNELDQRYDFATSNDPEIYGRDGVHAPCSSDAECQSRAASGEFNSDLLASGFPITDPSTYICAHFGGSYAGEIFGCRTHIPVDPACPALLPPAEIVTSCDVDKIYNCSNAMTFTQINDPNAACHALIQQTSDPSATGSCEGICCAVSCGGTESDCSTSGTDYCTSMFGFNSVCFDGCCLHAPDTGGNTCGGAPTCSIDSDCNVTVTAGPRELPPPGAFVCNNGCCEEAGGGSCSPAFLSCSQYPNPDAYCADVVGPNSACGGTGCCELPPQELCNDGIDNNDNQLIDCEDPGCQYDSACFEFNCENGFDDDEDLLTDCDDTDCSQNPSCVVCPSGLTGAEEQCFQAGCAEGDYCNYGSGCCQPVVCGDFNCSYPDETCDSCAQDCGSCPESDCSDGIDNNNDTFTDCADFSCMMQTCASEPLSFCNFSGSCQPSTCGDFFCDPTEFCICETDCGPCAPHIGP